MFPLWCSYFPHRFISSDEGARHMCTTMGACHPKQRAWVDSLSFASDLLRCRVLTIVFCKWHTKMHSASYSPVQDWFRPGSPVTSAWLAWSGLRRTLRTPSSRWFFFLVNFWSSVSCFCQKVVSVISTFQLRRRLFSTSSTTGATHITTENTALRRCSATSSRCTWWWWRSTWSPRTSATPSSRPATQTGPPTIRPTHLTLLTHIQHILACKS